jgi:hypothetical protein
MNRAARTRAACKADWRGASEFLGSYPPLDSRLPLDSMVASSKLFFSFSVPPQDWAGIRLSMR